MLTIFSCTKDEDFVPVRDNSTTTADLCEYAIEVRSETIETRLSSTDTNGDGFAEWSNNDAVYVALDGTDEKSFKLTYSSSKKNFAITAIGTCGSITSTNQVSALFTTKGSLSFTNGAVTGSTMGDVVYTKTGSCVVDDEAKTITFNITLNTRPVSLVKVTGIGSECYIDNPVKSYTKLTSLANMTWDTSDAPVSYTYKRSEDAVYCYGVFPSDGNVHIKYTSETKGSYTRTVQSVGNLNAGEMYILKGPNSTEASSWTEIPPDHYFTGEVYTYTKSSKAKPFTLVVLGDGFIHEDLLKSNSTFINKAKAAMDYMFNVEPYKTYKEYFNVYFIAAESKERGADITSTGQTRDTYFNTGWASATSYSSITNSGVSDFVKTYCPDIVNGKRSYSEVRVLMLCNENTYAGVCYTSSAQVLCFASISGSRTLAWSNYNTSVCGQNRGDYRNIVLHEFGGHAIGKLGDEYASACTDPAKILTRHITGFSLNVSTSNSTEAEWYSFRKALAADGGYNLDTSNNKGLGFYQCGSYEVYRPSYVSCMVDNRPFFDAWSRYLISSVIHSMAGESYSYSQFIQEVPKTAYDSAWNATRSDIDDSDIEICPMGAPPVFDE